MTSKRAKRRKEEARKFLESAITEDLLFPTPPENESEEYKRGYENCNMQIYKNFHDILRLFEPTVKSIKSEGGSNGSQETKATKGEQGLPS